MRANTRFQRHMFGTVVLITACLLIFFMFQANTIVGEDSKVTVSAVFQIQSSIAQVVIPFVMSITYVGILVRIAIGFGATRRGWFTAQIAMKLVFSVLLVALSFGVFHPLVSLFAGDPVAFNPGLALLLLPGVLLAFCAGELLGYIMARFGGGKTTVWTIVGAALLLVGLIILVVVVVADPDMEYSHLQPVYVAGALALSVLFEVISWRILRRMAA